MKIEQRHELALHRGRRPGRRRRIPRLLANHCSDRFTGRGAVGLPGPGPLTTRTLRSDKVTGRVGRALPFAEGRILALKDTADLAEFIQKLPFDLRVRGQIAW